MFTMHSNRKNYTLNYTLRFVLKSPTEYNIDFADCKNGKQIKFLV